MFSSDTDFSSNKRNPNSNGNEASSRRTKNNGRHDMECNPAELVQNVEHYAIPEFERIPFLLSGGIPGYRIKKNSLYSSESSEKDSRLVADEIPHTTLLPLSPIREDIIPSSKSKSPSALFSTGAKDQLPWSLVVQSCFEKMKTHDEYSPCHATDNERFFHHIDFLFSYRGQKTPSKSVKVLQRQKICFNDQEKQDDFCWILLHDIKPNDMGYLHETKLDYLAQEVATSSIHVESEFDITKYNTTNDGDVPPLSTYLLFDRKQVREFVVEKIPHCFTNDSKGNSNVTTLPRDSVYKILKIGKRNDIKTLVPRKDLMPFCVGKV